MLEYRKFARVKNVNNRSNNNCAHRPTHRDRPDSSQRIVAGKQHCERKSDANKLTSPILTAPASTIHESTAQSPLMSDTRSASSSANASLTPLTDTPFALVADVNGALSAETNVASTSPRVSTENVACASHVSAKTNVACASRVSAETNVACASRVSAKTNVACASRVSAKTNVACASHVSAKTNVACASRVSAETNVACASRVSAETNVACASRVSAETMSLALHAFRQKRMSMSTAAPQHKTAMVMTSCQIATSRLVVIFSETDVTDEGRCRSPSSTSPTSTSSSSTSPTSISPNSSGCDTTSDTSMNSGSSRTANTDNSGIQRGMDVNMSASASVAINATDRHVVNIAMALDEKEVYGAKIIVNQKQAADIPKLIETVAAFLSEREPAVITRPAAASSADKPASAKDRLETMSRQMLTIKETSGKGKGIFAKKKLRACQKLFKDDLIQAYHEKGSREEDKEAGTYKVASHLITKFKEEALEMFAPPDFDAKPIDIPIAYRTYGYDRALWQRAMAVVSANAWGDEYMIQLNPLFCFFNHSCAPNAVIFQDCAYTLEEIQSGEEVTIAYLRFPEATTTAERHLQLADWKFTCTCDLCLNNSPIPPIRHDSAASRRNYECRCEKCADELQEKQYKEARLAYQHYRQGKKRKIQQSQPTVKAECQPAKMTE